MPPNTPVRIRITPVAERAVRDGHPWVYADAVREASREGAAGDVAAIYDRKDRLLALGLFDPLSPIRVRVIHRGKPRPVDAEFWRERLREAVARRKGVLDAQTTACRLVHGESDGFPGFVIDKYAETLVAKVYSDVWKPRIGVLVDLLREELSPQRIVIRRSRAIGGADGETVFGTAPDGEIDFLETGLRFGADVLKGQKTGFFLDQRENRRIVETLARGREMLNAFSYSGGFSLYAARGGATRVVDLDESPHALEAANRNFARNPGLTSPHETVQADAFEWLGKTDRLFDLVVLDPPSFARREAERERAIGAYRRLAGLGAARLRPGGLLVACSCSAHVSAEEFLGAVREALQRTGRPLTELRTTRHPLDHPAGFREAEYLKALYLRL
ncbi:MAG: class I SAM-dependent methyltransferase [Planctomycetota bacterium]